MSNLVSFKLMKLFLHSIDPICILKYFLYILRSICDKNIEKEQRFLAMFLVACLSSEEIIDYQEDVRTDAFN